MFLSNKLALNLKFLFLAGYLFCQHNPDHRKRLNVCDEFFYNNFLADTSENKESLMRIVSWNCNGKFREKFKKIKELDADIYVIQECENPQCYAGTAYSGFAKNYIWNGENKNKGLGIFAKESISIQRNGWDAYCLRNFLSVKVNHDFDLLGVWACKPYIEEYYIYQCIYIKKYNDQTIIIGDFNSNKIWDKTHSARNHTNVVKELEKKNLISAYHYVYHEKQGEEKQPTFYLYRHLDKGYHTDHCFIKKERIKNYQVLHSQSWLNYSDHLPISLEI